MATATKSGAGFDIEEWAVSAKPRRRGKPCQTCPQRDVVESVRKFIDVRRIGRTQASIRDLFEILRDRMKYSLTFQSLRNHIINCERYNPSDEPVREEKPAAPKAPKGPRGR
jgi:hypothetical protein